VLRSDFQCPADIPRTRGATHPAFRRPPLLGISNWSLLLGPGGLMVTANATNPAVRPGRTRERPPGLARPHRRSDDDRL